MLVPPSLGGPKLTVSLSGGKVTLSFPTQSGATYQVQYKAQLTDPSWTSLGSGIAGNGSAQSAQDLPAQGSRFYRVQVSTP